MKKLVGFALGTILLMNTALVAEAKDNVFENTFTTEVAAVQEMPSNTPQKIDSYQPIAADTQEIVGQKPTVIVMNGSERYLQEEYQDILTRYFVKCYSQYRFPMTYGVEAQEDFSQACSKVNGAKDLYSLSQKELAEVLTRMNQEQILILNVHDRVYKKRRSLDLWMGSYDTWDVVVYLEAVLANKEGILDHKKYQYTMEEQYTPDKGLQAAYTRCIRQLQKSDILETK